jgi:pimeloyl-ACP methyl ester carboxylesterase
LTKADKGARPVFRSAEGQSRFMQVYDAVIANWPLACDEIDVPTRLGATHVIASGPPDAPPLILLPSLAATATLWSPNVAALGQHFRTYAIDTIGQVGKSVPTRRMRDRADAAGWLSDVMDGLSVARAPIVGASYGGYLAVNQAILEPQRVERIVLVGPAGTFVGLSLKFYYAMMVKGPIQRLLRRRSGQEASALPGGMALEAGEGTWGALMRVTMGESGRPDTLSAGPFPKDELKRITAPILLLIGEHEILYEAGPTLEKAKALVPGLTGAVIPRAGHLAAMMAPDDVNARVLAFLRPAST